MVLSGDTSLGRWMMISAFSVVRSSIFLILILPLSLAFIMDSISSWVVFP